MHPNPVRSETGFEPVRPVLSGVRGGTHRAGRILQLDGDPCQETIGATHDSGNRGQLIEDCGQPDLLTAGHGDQVGRFR